MIDVFVIGSPRSGTTLLRTILDGHSDLAIPPETYFVIPLLRHGHRLNAADWWRVIVTSGSFADWGVPIDQLRHDWITCPPRTPVEAISLAFGTYAKAQNAKLVGDKTPYHLRHIGLLAACYPEARFLHILRDGRDVARSAQDAPFASRHFIPNVQQWSDDVSLILPAMASLGSRAKLVRYEDLTTTPEQVAADVCAFLDIVYEPTMLDTAERGKSHLARLRDRAHLEAIAEPIQENAKTPLSATEEAAYLHSAAPALELLEDAGESVPPSFRLAASMQAWRRVKATRRVIETVRASLGRAVGRRQIDRFLPTPSVQAGIGDREKTAALILTYGAPESLNRCLEAIAAQTQPVSMIYVLDNAGTPPARPHLDIPGLAPTFCFRAPVNTGPAGGWNALIKLALDSDAGWFWLLDDDVAPDPPCHGALRKEAAWKSLEFVQPYVWEEFTGTFRTYPAWTGPLLSRAALSVAGLPRPELVWWAEDSEYLQERLPSVGFEACYAKHAVVKHSGVRRRGAKPTWKTYFEIRNATWLRIHVKQQYGSFPHMRRLARTVMAGFTDAVRSGAPLLGIAAVVVGFFDGLRGNLVDRPIFQRDPSWPRHSAEQGVPEPAKKRVGK